MWGYKNFVYLHLYVSLCLCMVCVGLFLYVNVFVSLQGYSFVSKLLRVQGCMLPGFDIVKWTQDSQMKCVFL